MQQPLLLAAVLATTGALAAPAAEPVPAPLITPAPKVDYANIGRRATACTFSGSAGYSLASKSKASCATIVLSALTVPSGVTLDLTDLNDDTHVIFEGETTFGYKEWDGPLFAVSGSGITVEGASGAVLNGNGADYWDGEGSNGGKTKPKFFQAHDLTSATIASVTISNAPVQVFSINEATHLALNDIYIDNKDGDDEGANTDGFDIGSSEYVTITGATVYNQDDCVAINSGSNIVFTGGYCSGGHGLSIGSIGGRSDNTVDTVTFESSTVIDSQNGVRIKTKSGDTGTVSGVTYSDITLSGITKYGIYVTQAYDGDEATTGIPITDFVLDGVTGDVDSSGYTVWIDCGSTSSCSGWTWTDVDVTGGKGTDCTHEPSAAESYC